MLKLESLGLELGGKQIFSDVNLAVREKESIALIGPSGAGKTLLLKTACGLIPAKTGRIFLFGQNLAKTGFLEKQELREKIGFSFQQAALFDFLDVSDNIGFPLKEAFDLGQAEIKARVDSLLKQLGLEGAGKKMPSQLSGGMKKRVSLGRAIVHRPKLLFCDDPTAGLDPITSAAISDLILKLREELQLTLVLISNQLSVIKKLADRAFMLYQGALREIGSAKDIEFSSGKEWDKMVKQ